MKNNIVMSEFLNSDDFEIESNHMLSRFHTIVKPRFVDGFIYSFFEDFNGNPAYKKRLGYEKEEFMLPRNSNLFDAKSKTITLSTEETDFINSGFFSSKLKSIYDKLYEDFDAFYRHFTGKNDYSAIDFYNSVIDFFKDNGTNAEEYKFNGAYNSNWGNLKQGNSLPLNKSLFKDEANKCNLNFVNYIEEKIKIIESIPKSNINQKPSLIFDKKTREDILSRLIGLGNKNHSKFLEYEKKLISFNYLNEHSNKWEKNVADFIRFYNYCESKNILKNDIYKETSKGVKLMRDLYDFQDGENLDTPSKRKKQTTKKTKNNFGFLDLF